MNCPHCGTPIDEHEAGRETDVCVAVAVMEWRGVKMGRDDYGGQPMPEERNEFGELLIWKPVPEYSAPDGIAAAWEVMRRVKTGETSIGWDNVDWVVVISAGIGAADNSAPLAICRAALKAVHETQTA